MIRDQAEIPADAVRIEEMINYFSYDYPEPKGEEPFSVTTEYSDCPWNEDSRLLLIGLQARCPAPCTGRIGCLWCRKLLPC